VTHDGRNQRRAKRPFGTFFYIMDIFRVRPLVISQAEGHVRGVRSKSVLSSALLLAYQSLVARSSDYPDIYST